MATTDFYVGAGDGGVVYANSYAGWNTIHYATAGTSGDPTSINLSGGRMTGVYSEGANRFDPNRSFLPVDTSAIDDTDTIDSAILKGYVFGDTHTHNTAYDYIAVVQTSQASTSTLVAGDFDQCGDSIDNPTEGSDRLNLGSFTTSAYNSWTLDATGLTWIDKTGVTKLGLRSGDDMQSTSPFGGATGYNGIHVYSSEQTGTSQDPYISVTHSAGGYAGSIASIAGTLQANIDTIAGKTLN